MVLHLAHHKSYHPYNRDNIEKVKKDEEAARRAEEEADRQLLEQDVGSRVDNLRRQADGLQPIPSTSTLSAATDVPSAKKKRKRQAEPGELELERQLASKGWSSSLVREEEESRATIIRPTVSENLETDGHINFWADLEKGVKPKADQSGNAEYLADKKKEDDKWDRQITMYLGRPASELKPWYGQQDLKNGSEQRKTQDQLLEAAYKDGQSKKLADPLSLMSCYLSKRDQVKSFVDRAAKRPSWQDTPQPDPKLMADPAMPLLRPRQKRGQEPAYKSFELDDDTDEYGPTRPQPVKVLPKPTPFPDQNVLLQHTKQRESSEKERAQALKKAARAKQMAASADSTPRSEVGYGDVYNHREVRDARQSRQQQYRLAVGRDGRAREGRSWTSVRWDEERVRA